MKLNGPTFIRLVSWPFSLSIRAWMSTLDRRVLHRDPGLDPLFASSGPRIYIFWHENILLPLSLRGNCHVSMLLSPHRDAEIVARLAGRFGFECVRGSTNQGATRALRGLAAHSRTHHLTLTPDGPRGPRRRLAQGPVYLASKLGLPIVCLGIAYHNPWRLNSWDRFAVPRPFSRARALFGEEIRVPSGLDRQGLESWRDRIEAELNSLTEEAQQWADSGRRREGEMPFNSGRGAKPAPRSEPCEAEAA